MNQGFGNPKRIQTSIYENKDPQCFLLDIDLGSIVDGLGWESRVCITCYAYTHCLVISLGYLFYKEAMVSDWMHLTKSPLQTYTTTRSVDCGDNWKNLNTQQRSNNTHRINVCGHTSTQQPI